MATNEYVENDRDILVACCEDFDKSCHFCTRWRSFWCWIKQCAK